MLTCRDVILDLLADYLEATLSPDVIADLERHLAVCPPCVAYLNTYKRTRELVGQTAPHGMPQEMKVILRSFLLEKLATEES